MVSVIAALVIVGGFRLARPLVYDTDADPTAESPASSSEEIPETSAVSEQSNPAIVTETVPTATDATGGEGDGTPSTSEGQTVTSGSVYRPNLESLANPIAQIGNRLVPRTYPYPLILEPMEQNLFLLAAKEENDGIAGLYADDAEDFRGLQVYLERYEDKKPLYVHKARDRAWPASLTKMLTVMVMLDEVSDLSQTVTITQAMLDEMARLNASVAGFSAGEVVSYEDLAYAAMLPSAGEAAYAIAVGVAGTEAAFAVKMNQYAEAIGMTQSNFTNSSGLHHNDQYSTAEDLAILTRHAWENETFRTIAATPSYRTAATAQHPEGIAFTHTILSVVESYAPEEVKVLGGKSGYTVVGGQCWATVCEVEGELYIAITLGSRTAPEQISSPYYDTMKLLSGLVDEPEPSIG